MGGLILRSLCYGIVGVSSYFLVGLPYLEVNLIFYPLAARIAYAAYFAASNVMVFDTLGADKQGSMLGVYSALVGLATMVGSLVSGFISYYAGYSTTFVVAGIFLAGGAGLTYLLT
jgi:predicted MFS family arabinose efflux permease